jgi:hypothetical protein
VNVLHNLRKVLPVLLHRDMLMFIALVVAGVVSAEPYDRKLCTHSGREAVVACQQLRQRAPGVVPRHSPDNYVCTPAPSVREPLTEAARELALLGDAIAEDNHPSLLLQLDSIWWVWV